MMLALQQLERVESRALGALRFFDATNGMTITAPLNLVAPPDSKIIRNRSGVYIVHDYAPLAHHNDAFNSPPALPPIDSLELGLTVEDPAGIYLARTAVMRLPRDPQPQNISNSNSIFRQSDVELYRSPAAPVGVNWAALRVSLVDRNSGDALGGALLRVTSNGRTLARGLSDWRGEALVPIVGIPITTWSEDESEVTVTAIDATVEALFDPAAGSVRTPAAQVAAGTPPNKMPVSDPEGIEANPNATRAQKAISLASGQPLILTLELDLPA